MQGHLYFIMGVSGSGKGTIRRNIEGVNVPNLEFLKSYVTREMRPGEINGDIYHFISKEDFEQGIHENDFLEFEINHKVAYYGTKKSEVEHGLSQGKIMMKEIDTKGLKQLNEKHPDFSPHYSSFFLDISNEEMRRRFYERNPDGKPEDIENRIESTNFEREQAQKYCDIIIDATQTPDKVLGEVLKFMKI
ncbi:guanylate kinase [Candidatus Gracilibacteria bacterium]|nr:guanylate kinase [Candidatus Gracilibacteria bacterium]